MIQILTVSEQAPPYEGGNWTKYKLLLCETDDEWKELKQAILTGINQETCSSRLYTLYQQLEKN